MREKVLRYIREQALICAGDRVLLAVSGGADSVALLRILLELRSELGIVLAVAHFNHRLRGGESLADEAFVAELAKQHELEFFAGHGDVRAHASAAKLSLEAAGRELRYRWLTQLADDQRFNCVTTAHTLDDQAETVLLKFLRGAGTRGLAGIYPVRQSRTVRIVRPLLCISRIEVEAYLESLGQPWREDESNLDRRFARNRVRHELLPLLEREFNPSIRTVLSGVAEVARAEEEFWREVVERDLSARMPGAEVPRLKPSDKGTVDAGLKARSSTVDNPSFHVRSAVSHPEPNASSSGLDNAGLKARSSTASQAQLEKPATVEPAIQSGERRLNIVGFSALPLALQRRLLRRFAEVNGLALDFEHLQRVLHCATGKRSKAELPGGWQAERKPELLELRPPQPKAEPEAAGYECLLIIPGEVHVDQLGLTIRALLITEDFAREMPWGSLLSGDLVGPELTVRNWRPGDRFCPPGRGSEEKLKRLFAEQHIPAAQRPSWPVALKGNEIVWVRGFPVARRYCWRESGSAVNIEAM